eukprot:gene4043-4388_t
MYRRLIRMFRASILLTTFTTTSAFWFDSWFSSGRFSPPNTRPCARPSCTDGTPRPLARNTPHPVHRVPPTGVPCFPMNASRHLLAPVSRCAHRPQAGSVNGTCNAEVPGALPSFCCPRDAACRGSTPAHRPPPPAAPPAPAGTSPVPRFLPDTLPVHPVPGRVCVKRNLTSKT